LKSIILGILIVAMAASSPAFADTSITFQSATQVGWSSSTIDNFTVSPATWYDYPNGVKSGTVVENSNGLGLSDIGAIGYQDYVVVDFSAVPAGDQITSVKFGIDVTSANSTDSWYVYELNSTEEAKLTGAQPTSYLAVSPAGSMASATGTGPLSFASFTGSGLQNDYYLITVDCHQSNQGAIELQSITFNYCVPEPATFVLIGAALAGLGLVLKKRNRV